MTYHHRFRQLGPVTRWRLYLEQQQGDDELIASGWAMTRNAAWRKSIAALPPFPPFHELLAEVRP